MYTIFFVLIIAISLANSRSIIDDDDDDIFTNSQRRFQQEILQAHNSYRARHCAPSLKLDDELSRSAQIHAEQIANGNGYAEGNSRGAGQNLYSQSSTAFLGSIDGRETIAKWYEGVRSYDFNRGGFSINTGSFTQLVWAHSRRLGVGIAYTKNGRSAYVVARYYPAGNYESQYENNVFPPQC